MLERVCVKNNVIILTSQLAYDILINSILYIRRPKASRIKDFSGVGNQAEENFNDEWIELNRRCHAGVNQNQSHVASDRGKHAVHGKMLERQTTSRDLDFFSGKRVRTRPGPWSPSSTWTRFR